MSNNKTIVFGLPKFGIPDDICNIIESKHIQSVTIKYRNTEYMRIEVELVTELSKIEHKLLEARLLNALIPGN